MLSLSLFTLPISSIFTSSFLKGFFLLTPGILYLRATFWLAEPTHFWGIHAGDSSSQPITGVHSVGEYPRFLDFRWNRAEVC